MTRSRVLILAAAILVILAGAGAIAYTATSDDPAPAAAAPSPTRAAATEVECVSITRAHTAWDTSTRAKSSPDFTALNRFTVGAELDAASAYRDAVTGYASQASKTLTVAAANLALELSVANASVAAGIGVDTEQAVKLQSAVAQVGRDYEAWRRATC